ncbi:hypothetical protein QYF36_008883 [Acer negundo]|nr:hypothetical protein QYF36_008883 [Acer negundo]
MMKLNLLASKKLMKLWVVLGVLIVLLSLVAAKSGGGGGRIGGGGGFGRGSTRGGAGSGRHVTGGGGHSRDEATPVAARGGAGGGHGGHSGGHGGCGGHRSTRGRGVLGAGSHRRGNEASTPSGANAWLSWSLGFFALILVEIVLPGVRGGRGSTTLGAGSCHGGGGAHVNVMQSTQAAATNGAVGVSSHQVDIQIEDRLNEEFSNREPSGRCLDLSLQIPPKPLGFGSSRNGKVLQSQGSYNAGSSPSPGGFFRGLSAVSTSERSSLSTDSRQAPESPNIANVSSAFSWQRCVSLPVTPASKLLSPSVSTPASARMSSEQDILNKAATRAAVSRSLSVPGRSVVIVRSISLPTQKEDVPTDTSDDQIVPAPMEANDEEIDEEEAVCRICLDVCEEGNTLKMECNCKGGIRLVHEECAIKWFSTKGNRNCEVCGKEVQNLPVNFLQVESSAQRDTRQDLSQQNLHSQTIWAWPDFLVHVLISTICYFLILEQLLIPDMNAQAIIIAALFAFTFGLLSSTFAVILAIRENIWIYAALEFFLVAIIVQLFYIMLHVKAIYAILLSAVLGFGTAMSLYSLYIHYFAWRVTVAQNPSSPLLPKVAVVVLEEEVVLAAEVLGVGRIGGGGGFGRGSTRGELAVAVILLVVILTEGMKLPQMLQMHG